MTWAEACEAMTQGKKARCSWWETGLKIGFSGKDGILRWYEPGGKWRNPFVVSISDAISTEWEVVK